MDTTQEVNAPRIQLTPDEQRIIAEAKEFDSQVKVVQSNAPTPLQELSPEDQKAAATLVDPDAKPAVKLPWNEDFQMPLFSLILTDKEFLTRARDLIKPNYWVNQTHQTICELLYQHFDKYKAVPDKVMIENELCVAVEDRDGKVKRHLDELNVLYEVIPNAESQPYYLDKIRNFAYNQGTKEIFHNHLEHSKQGKDDVPLEQQFAELRARTLDAGGNDAEISCLFDEIENLPDPELIVKDHIYKGTIAEVFGEPGAGKSLFAFGMAASIAAGIRFLGKYDTVKSPVVYLYSEGQRGIKKRKRAWCMAHPEAHIAPKDFLIIKVPFDLVGDAGAAGRIASLIQRRTGQIPALIIIDTLAENFGSGDENSNKDMNCFVHNLQSLKRLCDDAAILVVHHCGKNKEKGARGASALKGAMDTEINIMGNSESHRVEVRCTKQKDLIPFAGYTLGKCPTGPSVVLIYSGTVKEESEDKGLYNVSAVLPYSEQEAITFKELRERLDKPPCEKTMRGQIRTAIERGFAEVITGGKEGHRYYLTDKGQSFVDDFEKRQAGQTLVASE